MPLSLPIYFLGRTYVLHTRIKGRQVKRSLKTADPRTAKLRAVELLARLHMAVWSNNPKLSDFGFKEDDLRRYELDARNGLFKATDEADHQRMMQAYALWKESQATDAIGPIPGGFPKTPSKVADSTDSADIADAEDDEELIDDALVCNAKGPLFSVVFANFKKIQKNRDESTFVDYETNITEFEAFTGGLPISKICPQTISDFIAHLTAKGNSVPTIDKKVGSLRAQFNWGKKHKLVSGENFAANRNLQSKAEKEAGGLKFYELDEVTEVLGCERFKNLAHECRNFYLIMLAELVSGVRISALAALTAVDCRTSVKGNPYLYILDDKTEAGRRNVPIPKELHDDIKAYLTEHGWFGFTERPDGKGASDPVRKLLQEHLDAIGAAKRGFTVHGLRKTLNAYLFHNDVSLEGRCQLMGHKIAHVNVGTYLPGSTSQKYTLDKHAEIVRPSQIELLQLVGFI